LEQEAAKGDITHNVRELIENLYKLPMKGKDLEKAMEDEEKATHEVILVGRRKVNTILRIINRRI